MKKYIITILTIFNCFVCTSAQDTTEPEVPGGEEICQPDPTVYSLGVIGEGYSFSGGLYTHCFCDGVSYKPFYDWIEFEINERIIINFSLYNSPQESTSFRIEEILGGGFSPTYILKMFENIEKGRHRAMNVTFNKGRYRLIASYACGDISVAETDDMDGNEGDSEVMEVYTFSRSVVAEDSEIVQPDPDSDMDPIGPPRPTPGTETTGMLSITLSVNSSAIVDNPGSDNPPVEIVDYQSGSNVTVLQEDRNFIVSVTPTVETEIVSYYKNKISTNSKNTENEPLISIQYFDGLGRLEQAIQRNVTPEKSDLISFVQYDPFNRENVKRLPYLKESNNGQYVDRSSYNPVQDIHNNDIRPYSAIDYEASPLNRVIKQTGPGNDWFSDNSSITTEYLTNRGTSGDLACALYLIDGYGLKTQLKRDGYYNDKQLLVTKVKDEGETVSYEFRNVLGQVILTRQINYDQNNNKQLLDTYYVYDDLGNQVYVLPPLASDALTANGVVWNDNAIEALNQYSYIYKYGSGGKCIRKKIPGTDWIYYSYDDADQLLMTQTGEQRADGKNEALVNITDIFGRIVITGIYPNFSSSFYPGSIIPAKIDRNTVNGSSNSMFLYSGSYMLNKQNGLKVLTANYYDNYEYLLLDEFKNIKYTEDESYGCRYGNENNFVKHKGLLTATIVAMMDNNESSSYLYSAMHYDRRGNLIQTKSTNHLGGVEEEYLAYNFTGQPIKRKHVHSAIDKASQTEEYTYNYDHAGHLLRTTHKMNNGTESILTENEYDELGRLENVKRANSNQLKTEYAYNIRSWTKSISSPLFNQTLYYNEQTGTNKPQYGGNISAMQWSLPEEGKERGYNFEYDDLSRLTGAGYLVNGSARNNYSTAYSYDKHGNMLTTSRYGKTTAGETYGLVDNLTMTYNGNQLVNVKDSGVTDKMSESADFKDYSEGNGVYTYNKNGAMDKDTHKGITGIEYNSLNLPVSIEIDNGSIKGRTKYVYSASGAKLQVAHETDMNPQTATVMGSAPFSTETTNTKVTDYVGNKIYEDGVLKKILVDGGYIDMETGEYHFYITDHLGNNRVVAKANGTVVQKNHYYPFGMEFAENSGDSDQPYKYNGKELDKMHGLNMYDYSARYYEPAIGRFTTVDPLAEKYYSISPYAYCANNPLKYIDKDGRQIEFPQVHPFGSPQNLRNAALNQNIEQLQIHAAKPAGIGRSISIPIPFNLINTFVPGIEAIFITKGPKEGTLAIYGTLEKTKGLPDVGVSEGYTMYHIHGDERRLDEDSFSGESTGVSASVKVYGNVSVGVNKSEAETSDGDKIKGTGIEASYGKSLPVTGKKNIKSSFLIKAFQLYGNKNEKYNPKESTNDYYIRRYTNLKDYEKATK